MPVPKLPVMGTAPISTPSARNGRSSSSDLLKTGFAALLCQGLLPVSATAQGTQRAAKGLPVPAEGYTGIAAAGKGRPGIPAPTTGQTGNPAIIEGYPGNFPGFPGAGLFSGESKAVPGGPNLGGKNPGGTNPGVTNSGGTAAESEELIKLLAGLLSSLAPAATGRGGAQGPGPDALAGENPTAKMVAELRCLAGILTQAGKESRVAGPVGAWQSILDSIMKTAGRPGDTPNFLQLPQGAAPADLLQALRVLLTELSGTVENSGAPQLNQPVADAVPAVLLKAGPGKGDPQGSNNNSSPPTATLPGTGAEPGASATGGASTQDGRSGGQRDAPPQNWAGLPISGTTGKILQPAAMGSGSEAAPVEIWQQVGKALAQNLRRESPQIKELTIQLQPEKLGKIQVLLNWDDKQVNLQITAADDSTAKMLQGHIHDLRNALENAGVACGTLDLGSGGSFGRPWRENAPQPFRPELGNRQEQARTPDALVLPYEAPGDEGYRVNLTA
ncbi:Flagellar hook-length control protein-like, C-terminal [Acididesulfobacillus acetoxydans]|uniref:Flagellar hook-length control protein signature n=1 Tax=Acididesulfobacillus acetoxydans TaxID=1561005 RepID=A0A8S0Y4H3_9FIRM|nr:flagellar hook-length control protein FliK [Acididesulfobacillus acetoxydans]CAA7602945.1 Flagellar hook-length control protein-like, C-terminal [Acididesulfobacillus acetoxydans]CEJ05827.1 Flagellar hook-length control protein signature [Acididesulfobacillus acetoxydans]